MRVHLASEDQQVQNLCQQVLRDVVGDGWVLQLGHTVPAELAADLYIWDIAQHGRPPHHIAPNDKWRHFFLIDRLNHEQIRNSMALTDAQIVLKPVTRGTLTAFFSDAFRRCVDHGRAEQPEIASLRSDRDEVLQFLMQANLKLQEYDHDRTNFLARAVHDFRTPLTAITGYCGLILNEELGTLNAQQREVLSRIHRSARKLSRMASAMFQLSVAPRLEVSLALQDGDIRDCIDHAINEILPSADEKRISIEIDMSPSPEPLCFEAVKVEQVLVNLLENSCKFTPRAGKITITARPYFWERRTGRVAVWASDRRVVENYAANAYRIDIQDSGPGIPKSHLPQVFEEYTTYGGGADRSGGGLGLAICRMIVQQHKGAIWAENTNEGTVFSFVLPFHRQVQYSQPAMRAAVAEQRI